MTKHIEFLAAQAWVDDDNHDLGGYTDLEQFAKLIIQECMNNLEWHGYNGAVSQLEWFKVNRFGV